MFSRTLTPDRGMDMLDLIRFELKKIVGNRAGMLACAFALLIIVGITILDAVTTQTYDLDGKTCSGLAGLDAYREKQESHAGTLDADRVAEDMAVYDRAEELAESEEPTYSDMSSEQILETYGLEFWRSSYAVLHDTYYTRLRSVMLLDDEVYADDLQQACAAGIEEGLKDGLLGYYDYTPAEESFWLAKASRMSWPLEYGYADGWVSAFNWTTFLALPIVALCVALSGVFSGEYQSRAASVVLPTRLGKRELPVAKVVASLIFATVYWWLSVAVMLGAIFAFFGAEGASLPFQMMGYANPYPLTMAGATALRCALGYVIAFGMAGFTLLLSSKMRSSMPAAVIPMAIVLLGFIGIFFTPAAKVAALTPLSSINWSFSRMASYAAGSLVLDLPSISTLLYAAMLVTLSPLAMRAFARHQVS